MTKDDWLKLICHYAPQVRVSGESPYDDPYPPANINWYLENTSVQDADGVIIQEDPTPESLPSGQPSSKYHLAVDTTEVYRGSAGKEHDAVMYAHVRRGDWPDLPNQGSDCIDLQYWFFSPYNGQTGNLPDVPDFLLDRAGDGYELVYQLLLALLPDSPAKALEDAVEKLKAEGAQPLLDLITQAQGAYPFTESWILSLFTLIYDGTHEGDWEHVTVRVSNWRNLASSKIVGVFFARHGKSEGHWIQARSESPLINHYTVVDGSHVVVYSAWHTHASYESGGLKVRPKAYYFANDVCTDGGRRWGYLGEDQNIPVELIAVDEDVDGGEGISPAAWLSFGGQWGSSEGSPRTPSTQGVWRFDGTPVPFKIAPIAESWDDDSGMSDMAFGTLDNKAVVGVAVNNVEDEVVNRFEIYYYDVETKKQQLQPLLEGGEDWDGDSAATGIDFGQVDTLQVFGVTRQPGSDSRNRVELYTSEELDGSLQPAWLAGDGEKSKGVDNDRWPSGWSASDISMLSGLRANEGGSAYVAVSIEGGGFKHDKDPRFYIYELRREGEGVRLEMVAAGAKDWADDLAASSIAMTSLNGRIFVLVGSGAKKDASRFCLYEWTPGVETPLKIYEGGSGWDKKRSVTSVAFGRLDGIPVFGVTLSKGDGGRFFVYRMNVEDNSSDFGLLELINENGAPVSKNWSDNLGATSIAFGALGNPDNYIAVGRTWSSSTSSDARVHLYRATYDQGSTFELTNVTAIGSWGEHRFATVVGLGLLGEGAKRIAVLGYGRNNSDKEAHERGFIYHL